jgi:UDPglucose 6-dehydrogenase
MDITVIGGGFVGVVSAICFCEFGFQVWLCEEDPEKLNLLKDHISPACEPGISQALEKFSTSGQLKFAASFEDLIEHVDVVVIAILTTKSGDDSNMSFFHDVIRRVCLSLSKNKYTMIIIKTNLPIGSCSLILENTKSLRTDLEVGTHYDIVANPGLLREGIAIQDFIEPSSVLIGLSHDSPRVRSVISELYAMLIASDVPFIYSSYETVELVRAATIGFVAVKMAYINEICSLCDKCGVDINLVIKGISLDNRIGAKALKISPGFGGASFPRTARALLNVAQSMGMELSIIKTALNSNTNRIAAIKNRIMNLVVDDDLNTIKRITILGLSFKPMTSDIVESPSIFVIQDLLTESCVEVYAYDPLYKPQSDQLFRIPHSIRNNKNFHIAESVYDAASQSDILVFMTNWNEFMSLDFGKIHELMNKKLHKKPIILDYRNMFSKKTLSMFNYIAQGI